MSTPTPEIIRDIVGWMDDKKAENVKLYDLQGQSPLADWMIFCTGQSDAQVRAIADYCEAMLDQHGERCCFKEGFTDGRWIILDYIHLIIHVFQPAVRDYYRIDQIWDDYQASIKPE